LLITKLRLWENLKSVTKTAVSPVLISTAHTMPCNEVLQCAGFPL
jgi:hypothetical protein